jgi:hypothetical protein
MKLVTIKKALPVLWRYLLVVCVSCGLAYFISQSKVYATPSLGELLKTVASGSSSFRGADLYPV